MEIHSNSYSLDMLLSSNSGFVIPELQRPYAWRGEQVRDFIGDVSTLIEVLEKDPASNWEHLFGMVVSIGPAGGIQSVVDGQQRLTTTTVALGVLMSTYQSLRDAQAGGVQHAIAVECEVQIQNLRNLLFCDPPNTSIPRLTTSKEVEETYESLITGGDGLVAKEGLQPARRLREAAKLIKDELLLNDQRFNLVGAANELKHYKLVEKVLLKRLKFIHVRTTSPEAGYGLFETLNTRGQRLNALDLVKVWIMSQLAGKPTETMVAKQFRGLANDDTDLELGFLRDYFRAQAFRSPDDSNEVTFATDVRRYIFKDPTLVNVPHALETEQQIISHVDRMEEWYDLWLELRIGVSPYHLTKGTPDADVERFVNERLNGLVRGLGHQLVVPLLVHLSATKSIETFALAIHDIERFFFRYKKICGGAVGPMERVYLSWCSKLAAAPKADLKAFAADLAELLDQHANDAKFGSRLQEKLLFGGPASQKTVVYFLKMLEADLVDGDPWTRSVPGAHVIQIEESHKVFDQEDDAIRLGNLMLVTDAERKLLQGKSFAQKKKAVEGLKGGLASKHAARALKQSAWSTDAVDVHEQSLIKAAASAFGL